MPGRQNLKILRMTYLILGLIIFLAVHSVRIVADDWRTLARARIGERRWKGVFSIASLLGLGLIVWGFGLARQQPVQLWSPPLGLRNIASLLTLTAFVLLAAAGVPGNMIKARLQHPLALAIMVLAFAHLLANGNSVHLVLFGSFLLWSLAAFLVASKRDQRNGHPTPRGAAGATGITVAIGFFVWFVFALWSHGLLFGVRPFG